MESEAEIRPGDLLVGERAIRAYLVQLGMPETTSVYYLKSTSGWPIGKSGGTSGSLIASKRGLARYANEIARGSTATARHANKIARSSTAIAKRKRPTHAPP
jgi:hypothetical protein